MKTLHGQLNIGETYYATSVPIVIDDPELLADLKLRVIFIRSFIFEHTCGCATVSCNYGFVRIFDHFNMSDRVVAVVSARKKRSVDYIGIYERPLGKRAKFTPLVVATHDMNLQVYSPVSAFSPSNDPPRGCSGRWIVDYEGITGGIQYWVDVDTGATTMKLYST